MSLDKSLVKISCLTLILMMSLSFAVFPIQGQGRPKLFVVPEDNIFSTDTTVVGAEFRINISTSDWEAPGLFSFQFELHFDPALLTVVNADYPPDLFLPAPNFPVPVDTTTFEKGYVLFGVTKLGVVPGSTGSGGLGYINFKIKTAPPTAGSVSCDLSITNIILLNPEGGGITEYDVVDGYYEFSAPKPPLPYLKVVPELVSAEKVGDRVSINITVQELLAVWRAVAFQWKLVFDPNILEYVNSTEGDFLKNIAASAGPGYGTYFAAAMDPGTDFVISFSLYFKSPWPPTIFPEGSGNLATMAFTAIKFGSCDLTLTEVMIVDVEGKTLETRPPQSGFFSITPPWLSVDPKEKTATTLGEEFDLTVLINNLGADWRMAGLEFKVRYNSQLLDLLNITEGGFMKHFAERSETNTWFQFYVEEDPTSKFGIVGIIILPLPNGTWPGPFPDTKDYGAPGDLAIVKFSARKQDLDVTDEKAIWLDEIILADTTGQEIPYNKALTAAEGKCKYTWQAIPLFAGELDLFTQYSYDNVANKIDLENPYGGIGINKASDAFPPQALVKLYAYVAYQKDPVPGKPVSFDLSGPDGTHYTAVVITDANGIANLSYVLPWDVVGVWHAVATVALGGTMVSDRLSFREDWLVKAFVVDIKGMTSTTELLSAEVQSGEVLDKTDKVYYKGENLDMAVNLKVITMQNPRVCMEKIYGGAVGMWLKVTIFDDLMQPVANAKFDVDDLIEDAPYINTVDFERTIEGLITFGATIRPNAFSGPAHVSFNVFTDEPGVPYCTQAEIKVWIKKGQ